MSKKDLFGFVTQGINYELFRPRYPQALLGECLLGLKFRDTYLDVGTGTGQVLFAIAQAFNKKVIGTDPSENMVGVATQKAHEVRKRSGLDVEIIRQDCLAPAPYGTKFDLITVGQALHWFDVKKFLQHSKQMINPYGKFACLGYYVDRIDTPQGNINKHYEEFYSKVKPLFDFDRDELHRQYTDQKYCFQEVFPKVKRLRETTTTELSKEAFIGYMKTYSGYNTYLEQKKDDPIKQLEEGLKECTTLAMKVNYFGVYCWV